jgi:hypothetical protein
MKIILKAFSVSAVILIFMIFIACIIDRKTYRVELTFCDGREKQIVYVKSILKPGNHSINNQRKSVTEYNGYLNVCNVLVLGTSE